MFACLPRALRQRLLSKRSKEEARLNEESERTLEELRVSAQEERQRQQDELRSDPALQNRTLANRVNLNQFAFNHL